MWYPHLLVIRGEAGERQPGQARSEHVGWRRSSGTQRVPLLARAPPLGALVWLWEEWGGAQAPGPGPGSIPQGRRDLWMEGTGQVCGWGPPGQGWKLWTILWLQGTQSRDWA